MADVNRGDRPLSPHLQVYRPQITSVLSILHRMTGVALLGSVGLVTWWLLAAASGDAQAFKAADAFLASGFGGFIMICSLFGLAYHTLNGVRHLFWDAGYGFSLGSATASGWAVVVGSFAITGLVWFAWAMG